MEINAYTGAFRFRPLFVIATDKHDVKKNKTFLQKICCICLLSKFWCDGV